MKASGPLKMTFRHTDIAKTIRKFLRLSKPIFSQFAGFKSNEFSVNDTSYTCMISVIFLMPFDS